MYYTEGNPIRCFSYVVLIVCRTLQTTVLVIFQFIIDSRQQSSSLGNKTQPLHNFLFFFLLFWQFKPSEEEPTRRAGLRPEGALWVSEIALSFLSRISSDSSFHSTVDGEQPTSPRGAVRCFSHPHLPGHTPLIINPVNSERAVTVTMSSHSRPGKSSLWTFSAFHLRLPLSEQDKHYGIGSDRVSVTSVCK